MSFVSIDKGRESYVPCDVVGLVNADRFIVKLAQNPFIDNDSIICVDGRLLESSIDNDKQFVVKFEM